MTRPVSSNENVIGKDARYTLHGSDKRHPWLQHEGHHEHRERASLGNPAWMGMRFANMPTNEITRQKIIKEGPVSSQNLAWKISAVEQREQKRPKNLRP